jgi:hypothetical protein
MNTIVGAAEPSGRGSPAAAVVAGTSVPKTNRRRSITARLALGARAFVTIDRKSPESTEIEEEAQPIMINGPNRPW